MHTFPSPTPLTDLQNQEANRLMDQLDNWSGRSDGRSPVKRSQPRTGFRRRVYVFIPDGFQRVGHLATEYGLDAWARNISQGGLSLITFGEIHLERAIICVNPGDETEQWLHASMARRHRISETFRESGMKFEGRFEPSDAALPTAWTPQHAVGFFHWRFRFAKSVLLRLYWGACGFGFHQSIS
jgi:hypothetical protein